MDERIAKVEKFLKAEHLIEMYKDKSELPEKIRLDASTICQLNCVCCYMRNDNEGVENGCKRGFLSFENFKKLVDENDFIKEIELSNSGEILLNPELIEILRYAYLKKIRLSANNGVNLNNLSDKLAEALVRYNFNSMTISIDGASQETYSQYRVNGNYDKVIENIKKINYYKIKYRARIPDLVWKFIVFGHNEHEIPKAKEEAEKLGISIKFDVNWDKDYSPIKDKEFVLKETNISCIDNADKRLIYDYKKDNSNWFFCKFLWEQPQINWDGQVLGCCADYRYNFGGNVFKEGFLNALNNPIMVYAKNMVTNNAIPIDGVPCSKCWFYEQMKDMDFWIESLTVKKEREKLSP